MRYAGSSYKFISGNEQKYRMSGLCDDLIDYGADVVAVEFDRMNITFQLAILLFANSGYSVHTLDGNYSNSLSKIEIHRTEETEHFKFMREL